MPKEPSPFPKSEDDAIIGMCGLCGHPQTKSEGVHSSLCIAVGELKKRQAELLEDVSKLTKDLADLRKELEAMKHDASMRAVLGI